MVFPDEGSIAETLEFYLQLSAFHLSPSHLLNAYWILRAPRTRSNNTNEKDVTMRPQSRSQLAIRLDKGNADSGNETGYVPLCTR